MLECTGTTVPLININLRISNLSEIMNINPDFHSTLKNLDRFGHTHPSQVLCSFPEFSVASNKKTHVDTYHKIVSSTLG